jgi:hypothetical protein
MNNRKTYGLSLNRANPDDVRLITVLQSSSSVSGLLRQALLAYLDGGNQEPAITEQELADLRGRMAWLEQNQAGASIAIAARPGSQAAPTSQIQPGNELSEVFLAGIKKIARPGIRLGE